MQVDHLVVNARRDLDGAREAWTRLGFILTPLGRHTLGSINHLVVLDGAYVELLGLPPAQMPPARPELMSAPAGLFACALASADAAATARALAARLVEASPPQSFSRPVEFAAGGRTIRTNAEFDVVRLPLRAAHQPRLFFCHHRTPELVWRRAWQRHPNGAQRLLGLSIAAGEVEATAAYCAQVLGAEPVSADSATCFDLGGVLLEVALPARIADRLGPAHPEPGGRPTFMASMRIGFRSLDRLRAQLARNAIAAHDDGGALIRIPAGAAGGVCVEAVDLR